MLTSGVIVLMYYLGSKLWEYSLRSHVIIDKYTDALSQDWRCVHTIT
jgi:hypothetical protein